MTRPENFIGHSFSLLMPILIACLHFSFHILICFCIAKEEVYGKNPCVVGGVIFDKQMFAIRLCTKLLRDIYEL